jgi:hypothetical protein
VNNISLVDRLVEQSSRLSYQTLFSGGEGDECLLVEDIANRLLLLQREIRIMVEIGDEECGAVQKILVNCQLAYLNRLSKTAQRFQSTQKSLLQSTARV